MSKNSIKKSGNIPCYLFIPLFAILILLYNEKGLLSHYMGVNVFASIHEVSVLRSKKNKIIIYATIRIQNRY